MSETLLIGMLAEVDQTGFGCPTVWEGTLQVDGDSHNLYIRYRYGHLSVSLNGEDIYGADLWIDHDGGDGVISWEEASPYVVTALCRYQKKKFEERQIILSGRYEP